MQKYIVLNEEETKAVNQMIVPMIEPTNNEDRTQFRVALCEVNENNNLIVNLNYTYNSMKEATRVFNSLSDAHNMFNFARRNTYKILENMRKEGEMLSFIRAYQYLLRVNLNTENNNKMLLLIEIQQ